MAMNFYNEELVPSASMQKIQGPAVSISFRRSQITFTKEASELMNLVEKESFILVGFDDEAKQVGFQVVKEPTKSTAVVEKKIVNIPAAPEYMFIKVASVLESIPDIPRDAVCKYPLYDSNKGYFYINLSEGCKVPKAKKKPKE